MSDASTNGQTQIDPETLQRSQGSSSFVPFAGGLVLGVIVGALGGAFFGPIMDSKVDKIEPSKIKPVSTVKLPEMPANPEDEARKAAMAEAQARKAAEEAAKKAAPTPTPAKP